MKFTRRISILCCLLTLNLLLAPVVHAAVASPGNAEAPMQHAGFGCEQAMLERLDSLGQSVKAIDTGNGCQLDSHCGILCGMIITDAQPHSLLASGFNRSHRWSVPDLSAYRSSCLPRFEKPPRT